MNFLYNILVFKATILLSIIAFFSKKIKLFVDGRKETFSKIEILKDQKTIWIHAASLVICYMPLDSKANAKKFIETVNPKFAIFIKYEFWPNFLNELKKKEIPTILVSGILRKNQIFFKSYGGFMRKSLQAFFCAESNFKRVIKFNSF